jgi:hypothetical protein
MNEIETHVLDLIGENSSSPDVFTEGSDQFEQIRGSINDAIEEVTMITGINKRTYYLSMRAEKNFYHLDLSDGDIAWVNDVWLLPIGRRLVQKDFIAFTDYNPRWLYNNSNPERYCMIGVDKFCIHPSPSSSDGTLEITCVVIPKRYTSDTDRVKLREEFKWAVVNYAVSEYYASRGDAKRAVDYFSKYAKKLGLQDQYQESQEREWGFKTEKRDSEWIGQSSVKDLGVI